MINFFKDIFHYLNTEKKGVKLLLLLIIAFLLIRFYYKETFENNKNLNFSGLLKNKTPYKKFSHKQKIVLFKFNPNSTNDADFEKLGLKKYQIKNIRNFLKKGSFKTKTDFKKLYTIDEILFNKLRNYIDLPDKFEYKKHNKYFPKKSFSSKNNNTAFINSATEEDLIKVKGIGPAFSKRICKYRDLLGGYTNINQLKEVYGINDSIFNVISKYLILDNIELKRINLNTCDYKELTKHPYVSKVIAKGILNLRKQSGNFTSVDEIKSLDISEESFNKLKPYLLIEE